jgi:hypothetical protein
MDFSPFGIVYVVQLCQESEHSTLSNAACERKNKGKGFLMTIFSFFYCSPLQRGRQKVDFKSRSCELTIKREIIRDSQRTFKGN